MKMSQHIKYSLALCLTLPFVICSAVSAGSIAVSGEFYHTTPITLTTGMRLKQAILLSQPKADAYRDGFSIEREDQKKQQTQYKAFLLANLHILKQSSTDANKLYQALWAMPVTGRMKMKTDLDELLLQFQNNPLVKNHDVIYLPKQPSTVQLYGWAGNQQLPFHYDFMLIDYLKDKHYSPLAEKNFVYVISPNGALHTVHTAYWNHSNARISPGTIIYVPLSKSSAQTLGSHFNLKMAQFLSTQRIS